MKNKYFLITIFSLILSVTSCSSDDSSNSKSASEMISSKAWLVESKMLSPTIDYGGLEITDIMIIEPEETRNYTFTFNSDGTLLQNDAMGNLIFETTWVLNSDNTQLLFGEPIVYSYPIVGDMGFSTIDNLSISSSQVVGTISATFGDVEYEVTITFI